MRVVFGLIGISHSYNLALRQLHYETRETPSCIMYYYYLYLIRDNITYKIYINTTFRVGGGGGGGGGWVFKGFSIVS